MVLCKRFIFDKEYQISLLFRRHYPTIFDWQLVKCISVDLYPSIHLFLKQFDEIFPHINSIHFNMGKYSST
jgi:hypothetical protein